MKTTAITMITIRTRTPPPAAPPMIAPILSGLGSRFFFTKTRTILNLVSYQSNLYWWSIALNPRKAHPSARGRFKYKKGTSSVQKMMPFILYGNLACYSHDNFGMLHDIFPNSTHYPFNVLYTLQCIPDTTESIHDISFVY